MNIESKIRSSSVPTRLVWVDLEMTGLDTDVHRIVEVAMIITDFELNELATYEAVVHQPDDVLSQSNDFCMTTHTENGLYDKVRASALDENTVQQQIKDLITLHVPLDNVCLAGNSIRADRLFIDSQWPIIADMLHYRMLDVSSFKLWWLGTGREPYVKSGSHRALDDIRESIAELGYYQRSIK